MASWISASTQNRSAGSSRPLPGFPARTSGPPRCSRRRWTRPCGSRCLTSLSAAAERDHRQPRRRHHRRPAQRARNQEFVVDVAHAPGEEFAEAGETGTTPATPGSRCAFPTHEVPGGDSGSDGRALGERLAGHRYQRALEFPVRRRAAGCARSRRPAGQGRASVTPGR